MERVKHDRALNLQDELKRKVIQLREKEKSKEMNLEGGWYTEEQMKNDLKLSECHTQLSHCMLMYLRQVIWL